MLENEILKDILNNRKVHKDYGNEHLEKYIMLENEILKDILNNRKVHNDFAKNARKSILCYKRNRKGYF